MKRGRMILGWGLLTGLALALGMSIREIDWDAHPLRAEVLLQAFGWMAATYLLNFLGWATLLRRNLCGLSWRSSYRLFGVTALSRFLPGGQAWQYAVLAKIPKSAQGKVAATTSHLYATLIGLASGVLLLTLTIPDLVQVSLSWVLPSALLLFAGLFAVLSHPSLLRVLNRWVGRLTFGRVVAIPPLELRSLVVAFACFGPSWISASLTYSVLFHGLVSNSAVPVSFIIGAYCFSVLGGYLALVTPSGLGVREGLLVYLLSRKTGLAQAVFVSCVGGLFLLLAEVLFLLPLALPLLKGEATLFEVQEEHS